LGRLYKKRNYLKNCLKDIAKGLNGRKIYWKYLSDVIKGGTRRHFTKNGNPRHPSRLSNILVLKDFIEGYARWKINRS
jgi:hypothetical protein